MAYGADDITDINEWKDKKEDKDLLVEKYIVEIAKGNTDYMKNLYDSISSSVYGYAFSLLKNSDDAGDVLHDCFLKIYNAAPGYSPCGKPFSWIFTITKNLCMQKFRENSKQADAPDEDMENFGAINNTLSAEDSLIIKECMTILADDERQIVILHAVSGYKHREIADFLEIPLATVLSKYNRALKKLNDKLTEGGAYDE